MEMSVMGRTVGDEELCSEDRYGRGGSSKAFEQKE